MKITTFNNNKGLIHGNDPKRIGSAMGGVLKVGATEVSISPEADSIMPLLFNGGTGDYCATFTSTDGKVYDLGVIEVRGGRIAPPPSYAVEIMELRCRADATDRKYERLMAEVERLSNLFDTNSLNFLIR
jgi:hypothetical protein